MKRFIQGEHRGQGTLLPESLDDYVGDTNPVRVVDVFVDELDLVNLGFEGAIPADTVKTALTCSRSRLMQCAAFAMRSFSHERQ
ncbi:hypothetical protein [Pseudomonas sp. 28 E 9]|jgi:transposase|nr:hypothetical protein [Pseudomonas sp. 28 E 9]